MAWKVTQREIIAAHEVGHSLVAASFGCSIVCLRAANVPAIGIIPVATMSSIDAPSDLRVISTGGVAGVMLYRGWHLANNIFTPSLRHTIAKTRYVYAQSKTGCIADENLFNEEFSKQFSRPAPKGEFYKSALTSLEIIGHKEREFFVLHDALSQHGFLSRKNFYALQRGQEFDGDDNVVAKTLADVGA